MTKWIVTYEMNGKQQKPIMFNSEHEAKHRAAMISFGGFKAWTKEVEDGE